MKTPTTSKFAEIPTSIRTLDDNGNNSKKKKDFFLTPHPPQTPTKFGNGSKMQTARQNQEHLDKKERNFFFGHGEKLQLGNNNYDLVKNTTNSETTTTTWKRTPPTRKHQLDKERANLTTTTTTTTRTTTHINTDDLMKNESTLTNKESFFLSRRKTIS